MTTLPLAATSPHQPPDYLTTLRQAAQALRQKLDPPTALIPPSSAPSPIVARPASLDLVFALLLAEQAAKQPRPPFDPTTLWGTWRLGFTAPKRARLGAIAPGRYWPQFIPAQISFQPAPAASQTPASLTNIPATVGNQVQLGPLRLQFAGPARATGKKNLLVFDFLQVQLAWGNHSLFQHDIRGGMVQAETFYQTAAIAQKPFFAFFLITDDFIAARGRGGGLALWIKSPEVSAIAQR